MSQSLIERWMIPPLVLVIGVQDLVLGWEVLGITMIVAAMSIAMMNGVALLMDKEEEEQ